MANSLSKTESDYSEIYDDNSSAYDLLISKEDYEGNILPAINKIRSVKNCDIIDLGAGTGRITSMVAASAKSIQAYDTSAAMLEVLREKMENAGHKNFAAKVSDHRKIDAQDNSADLAIAGWSICHLVKWNWESWEECLKAALNETARVLRPGGTLIILETLGTGKENPAPPDEKLAAYYTYLEKELDFSKTFIRTDYKFDNMQECDEILRSFFGDALTDDILENSIIIGEDRKPIVPECTGIWWKELI